MCFNPLRDMYYSLKSIYNFRGTNGNRKRTPIGQNVKNNRTQKPNRAMTIWENTVLNKEKQQIIEITTKHDHSMTFCLPMLVPTIQTEISKSNP